MSWSASTKGKPSDVAAQIDSALASSQKSYEATAARGIEDPAVTDKAWSHAAAEEAKDIAAEEAKDIAGVRERVATTLANIQSLPGYEHVAVSVHGSRSPSSANAHFEIVSIPPPPTV